MQGPVNASIITIGTELLIGQVIDTNSAWIGQELNKEGLWIRRRIAVGDNANDIREALDSEINGSDIIILTGGLGPTADDITKPLLCNYFGGQMIINQEVLSHVKSLFENVFKRPFIERNIQQAEVPDCCTVLHNEKGTAPGMLFEKDGKIIISLPGVPHEMKWLITEKVIPLIRTRFQGYHIIHRTLLTMGIGESFLAEHIKDWENKLPAFISLAYLPNYGMVRLRLTGTGNDDELINAELEAQFDELKILVRQWLVIDEDKTLPQVISRILKEKGQTLSTAESCTGGYIAHLLTREPGSSVIFKGSIIAYANSIKENLLQVGHATLRQSGAVSEETVREMVAGALKTLDSDYALATSGIMGPDGGSAEKPVGMVWVAVGSKKEIRSQLFHFRFDRMRNIELTANFALNFLRKFILESEN